MRIGFDAKRLYSNYTGLGNYSRTIVKNLLEYYPSQRFHLYTPRIRTSDEIQFFKEHPNLETFVAQTKFKPYWRTYSITEQLKKDKIDLYHGLSNEIPQNLKKAKIKSVVTIHDLIFKVLPETFPLVDRKIYDLKFKKSCKKANKIIAISENTKKDLIHYYDIDEQKIEVIYQSCNPIFYREIDILNSKQVLEKYSLPTEYNLFVGSIEKRKNLKLIIDAYNYISKSDQIPLVIVGGSRTFNKELSKLIGDLEAKNKLIWLKNLNDNTDLQAIYTSAQMLVYPSLYEGFGLPIVEALLSKTPVITSNTSSLPEAAGKDSMFINPQNPEELAEAILKVQSDSELRNKMIEKGYLYATQKFAPEKLTNQLFECYKNTLAS